MKNHVHPNTEKLTAGVNEPFWVHSAEPIAYDKLALDKEVDVVVVGGGIAGVTIAYCLAKAGKSVALVEDGFIGSGETGRTTAHLVTALDNRYYELERLFGQENTALIAQSHNAAIDFVEHVCNAEKINCDFERVSGYLFSHPSDEIDNLLKEYHAAKKAGLDVEFTDMALADKALRKAIKFNRQAQIHPLKYLKGLGDAVLKHGGQIYTNTQAAVIDGGGVTTGTGHRIKAGAVVVATNTPVNNKYTIHLKQYPYRTYVIAALVKKGLYPHALWWDTGDFSVKPQNPPYHYVRLQAYDQAHDLLIIGGEDHATGMADASGLPEEARYDRLKQWASLHFEGMGEIVYRWSGQVMEPMDALAYIGHNPGPEKNVYIVTGDSGNGMTHGTLAGNLIRDLISGHENKLAPIYDPGRVKWVKAGRTFLKEFVGGYISYLKNKPGSEDEKSLEGLRPNEGRIFEFEGKKLGAYRDEEGHLHFIDAECTHLGCIVKWNNDEKSWDCPCHGSRFTYDGKVLNGPANQPLAYYSQQEKYTKHHRP